MRNKNVYIKSYIKRFWLLDKSLSSKGVHNKGMEIYTCGGNLWHLSFSSNETTHFKVSIFAANFIISCTKKNQSLMAQGRKSRTVKGRIISLFFSSPPLLLMSIKVILFRFSVRVQRQIGCNNQLSSHSRALIPQHLSIQALPSAGRGYLGVWQLIGGDVLFFSV